MNTGDNMQKYHCIINGIRIDDIDECSIDGIYNAIVEGNYSGEIVNTIECLVPSLNEAVCENFSWDFVEDIQKYISNAYDAQNVVLQNESDIVIGSFPVQPILNDLCESYYADENGCVQAGEIWSVQLQAFINQGEWIAALRDEDGDVITDLEAWPKTIVSADGGVEWKVGTKKYTPILWYGLKGNPISEIWMVGRYISCYCYRGKRYGCIWRTNAN